MKVLAKRTPVNAGKTGARRTGMPQLRSRGTPHTLRYMSEDEHVVFADAKVMRLGFHEITYRVDGRPLVVPYSVVQPGSVIVLGARGQLIVPKWVVQDFRSKPQ